MNNQNSNKFNNLPLTDVESHDNDQSRVRVEKVLDEFEDNPDSNFFTYLCIVMFLSILFYILYHNRHKILALLLEGRRGSRRPRERSRGGSKAAYSKLDCNLEEAITSKKSLSGKSMDIIY
jgi:DNA-binding transcriptional ArsR family regulator